MSPAKQQRTSTSTTLTIDFSGVCTLVWNKKEGAVEIRMVDLASVGFEPHYAALGVVVSAELGRNLKGPMADAAVSLPGSADQDIGLWNLTGTDVEIIGGTGKVTVDDEKVDVTKKPGKKATSIHWLPNIGFLAESAQLDPVCPTSATVRIRAGHVTALTTGEPRRAEFVQDGKPVGPARYYVPRFRATIPFENEVVLKLDRHRVLRVSGNLSVIMSNACVCGLGVKPPANDFYGHYDVVQAKRRPTVQPAGPRPATPLEPEWCWGGFVEV